MLHELAYWLATLLAAGYAFALLWKPRWALHAANLAVSKDWLREDAMLHAALLAGLVTNACLTDDRGAAILGAILAVVLSSIVDLRRGAGLGLAFDGVMYVLLVLALIG